LYFLHSFVDLHFVQLAQVKKSFSTQHCFTGQFFTPTAHFGELLLQPSHFPEVYAGQALQ
ncbi:MAG: hypothetical protein FWG84_03515, partial [Bacteroidales bacterium]|nr:hypothetical protein [Bacteroidales bacterium]